MSLELLSLGPRSRRWLRVGPLARDLDGFATDLAAQGRGRRSAGWPPALCDAACLAAAQSTGAIIEVECDDQAV